MFRKPKRKGKNASLRKKEVDEDDNSNDKHTTGSQNDDNDDATTSELLDEARKRVKLGGSNGASADATNNTASSSSAVMHTYDTKEPQQLSRDLVTSTADHHPRELLEGWTDQKTKEMNTTGTGADGIIRTAQRNKFHAGPIRAAAHVRVTARFDYQPDICKDYKETGFCGFGDTCIYLHDRGDTLTGWQLEQQWEEQQKVKRAKQEQDMLDFATGKTAGSNGNNLALPDDGIPFACHLCRGSFKNPVATTCGHYFCEACIMNHVRQTSDACPICGKDTGSVFNMPTKLIAKKRKILGIAAAKATDSWEQYASKLTAGADS